MLNKCMFIGRLGKEPEIRVTQSGQKVANFSLAVSEKYKDKQGSQKESTEWVNVVLWGKQSEIAEKYLKKGSQIYIEGKWKTQSWEHEGRKMSKVELVGSHFLMLGSGSSVGQQQATQNSPSQPAPVPEYIAEEPPF